MISSRINSPIGWLEIHADDDSLREIRFLGEEPEQRKSATNSVIDQTMDQLRKYFSGSLQQFNLPIRPEGTTFQREVWRQLQHIPFGSTIYYGALAQRLGDPKKVRAVGRANGRNPIPIVIPCHRVIGTGDKLTGYGGGIHRKKWLLRHENALLL